jgi:hypothetical protein
MKIRNGFVSNSSSSSFILVFDEWVRDKEHLYDLLFTNKDLTIIKGYNTHNDSFIDSMDIAKVIYNDLRNASRCTLGQLYDLFEEMCYEEKSQKLREIAWTQATEFFDKYENKYIVNLEYGDDDTMGATIEHDNVFKNIEHIRINRH